MGADTETVLRELLRYDDARIAELRAAGAFGTPAGPRAEREGAVTTP
jgi:hypothetical protein